MAEQKPLNIHAILNETIEHIVSIEEQNFYFQSALDFARDNPNEYGQTAQLFEQCLSVVQAAPKRFDHSAALVPYARLRELVNRLAPPESLRSL